MTALDGDILLDQNIPTMNLLDAYNKLNEVKFVLSMIRRSVEWATQDSDTELNDIVDDIVASGIRVDKAMRVLKKRYFTDPA